MAEATIVIGTYGAQSWVRLARRRAIPSAEAQGPVVHVHGETLAKSRNAGLARVETEWVIHLDADDELAPGYVEAMMGGSADMRAGSRLDVDFHGQPMKGPYIPRVWAHEHACTGECLRHGNWLHIGTCLRTELAHEVGGWFEEGWSEDWSLWARCWKAGASIEAIPEAVYRAWRSRRSRNRVRPDVARYWHQQIEQTVWGAA